VGKHFDPEAFDAFERYLRKELADKTDEKKKPS